MAIIINSSTKVVVQGITGGQGKFHTARIKEYGTNIVGGVTPGKGGGTVEDISVYDGFEEIPEKPTASIIFVPAPFAKDAALEAIEFGLNPVVIITEHIPVHDSMEIVHWARKKDIVVVGPNTPGIITPGQCKMGVMPAHVFSPGNIGLISRSGTLTYEIVDDLTKASLGQSTAVGLGGDPIVGLSFIDLLQKFEQNNIKKPVVAYIAGRAAPKGKTMGHAGAIITGSSGTADSKIKALENAGVAVATRPIDIPKLMKERLEE